MTVLVGIRFKDGLIVASDSQETESDYLKRLDVRKVYGTDSVGFEDAKVILAGTGDSAHIQRLVELIHQAGWEPSFTKPRDVADIAERCMRRMAKRYGDDFDTDLMLGVYCGNTPQDDPQLKRLVLYTVTANGVAGAVEDYAALGSGGPFASYLLHRLHDADNPTHRLSAEAATREAIYVVEEAKKVQLHCGGATQVMRLFEKDGKEENLSPERVEAFVTDLKKRDDRIKQTQREMLDRAAGARKK